MAICRHPILDSAEEQFIFPHKTDSKSFSQSDALPDRTIPHCWQRDGGEV
jgi:hypothetical protein